MSSYPNFNRIEKWGTFSDYSLKIIKHNMNI